MSVRKLLIIFGAVLVGLSIIWPWISRLGLGSLRRPFGVPTQDVHRAKR